MWTRVSSAQEREALVQDYLARKARLRRRFERERLGEAELQTEAAKLFKPITEAVRAPPAEPAAQPAEPVIQSPRG